MSNFLKHTLAALSDEAAVLACEANEDMPRCLFKMHVFINTLLYELYINLSFILKSTIIKYFYIFMSAAHYFYNLYKIVTYITLLA